ncbi:phage holin [Domibacillus iocasae]|uniref:Phage holin n=1 Tax=Domibacillus iocasae TaxID=1714016 RepID=A0A1E7DQ49_9BACI|nr:phage holin [Domibacillus iocasae]OES45216.1 phage holin [Domibacillus iocasae]
MQINWKVRVRSLPFWVAIFALIGFILGEYGVYDSGRYELLVDLILGVFITGGIIIDPTTSGVEDSRQAMYYQKPREDKDR